MSLTDDINNLPVTPENVMPGHLNDHATIHSALKDHNSRLDAMALKINSTNYVKGVARDLNELSSGNDYGVWTTAVNCLNTPGPGFYHVLVYGTSGTTHRIQKATRYGTKAAATEHIRVLDSTPGSEWSPWERVDIRTDTTVGTRVFVGNTMIHGDTGRRSVPELTTSIDVSTSTAHGSYIRRVGDLVSLTASGRWVDGLWVTETLPMGFRPISGDYRSARGIAHLDGGLHTFGNGATLLRFSFTGLTIAPGAAVSLESSWYTADAWPISLPGLPA